MQFRPNPWPVVVLPQVLIAPTAQWHWWLWHQIGQQANRIRLKFNHPVRWIAWHTFVADPVLQNQETISGFAVLLLPCSRRHYDSILTRIRPIYKHMFIHRQVVVCPFYKIYPPAIPCFCKHTGHNAADLFARTKFVLNCSPDTNRQWRQIERKPAYQNTRHYQ